MTILPGGEKNDSVDSFRFAPVMPKPLPRQLTSGGVEARNSCNEERVGVQFWKILQES